MQNQSYGTQTLIDSQAKKILQQAAGVWTLLRKHYFNIKKCSIYAIQRPYQKIPTQRPARCNTMPDLRNCLIGSVDVSLLTLQESINEALHSNALNHY